MSNQNEEGLKKVAANPYNMKKAWHTDDSMPKPLQSADSGLYVPNPESTREDSTATADNSNPEEWVVDGIYQVLERDEMLVGYWSVEKPGDCRDT